MNANTTKALIAAVTYFLAGVVTLVAGNWYLTDLGDRLAEERVIVDQFESREQAYIQLNRRIETSAEERAEIVSHFLTEESTINFLTLLEEKIAADFGLDIDTTSLNLEESEDDTSFADLGIRLTITGEPEATKEYLQLLETLPYHSQLTSIEQTRTGTNWETAILLNVTNLTYDTEN